MEVKLVGTDAGIVGGGADDGPPALKAGPVANSVGCWVWV